MAGSASTFQVTATDPNTQLTAWAVVRLDVTVAVEEAVRAIPTEFRLYQNYPNPFNPETRIQYDLPTATRVRIDIFNILGQKIRTLVDEQKPAGSYSVLWDGRMDHGETVASREFMFTV